VRWAGLLAIAALLAWDAARAGDPIDSQPTPSGPIVVIANTPLPGTGIAVDKIAGEVETLSVPELTRDRHGDVIANLIASQLGSISVNDEQGSPFQPDFTYRGFRTSPISGVAEGLAVYQDGVRLNESFGDNVNWDLVPEFAVNRFTVQSNNPVFGLNALGGAVTLEMKNGLNFHGFDAELSGGSFGNVTGHAEYGTRVGDFGLYLGVGGVHDNGFRDHSPTTLRQAYGDISYRHDRLTLHVSTAAASNDIDAVGPTPVELLAQNSRASFTLPQTMRDRMAMVQLRGSYEAGDHLMLNASGYYRRFVQHLVDGNTTGVRYCNNNLGQLCLGGNNQFPGDALYDSRGNPVAASVLPAGATPGETDFIGTRTNSFGGTFQASLTAPLGKHANSLVIGASFDHGVTRYSAFGELGTLQDNLRVVGSGVIIDQGRSPTAQPPIESPVDVVVGNSFVGLYAIDVLDVTPRLALTLSGRWNSAGISLRDQTGGSLNADHRFSRFNPGVGLAFKASGGLTVYAGYSESNRAPTAAELSCADPTSPCLLGAFLVSDPKLKQVVSRNFELGLHGRFGVGGLLGTFSWAVSTFRTQAQNDILLVATNINGFGFFKNAGATRRQGIDARFGYRDSSWRVNASYAYVDATFRNAQALSSNSPAADPGGLIFVRRGSRLPMSPTHRLTLSADYDATPAWSLGADVRWQSGQYLVGDESNQQPKLPGFATANLRTSYKIGAKMELFGEIENLFDKHYFTYGAFAALDGLPANVRLSNPRTYSPAARRAFTVGTRVQFD
jgi:iron complex outermembrane receptor protein